MISIECLTSSCLFLALQLPMQGSSESSGGVGPFRIEFGAEGREFEVWHQAIHIHTIIPV